MSSGGNNMTKLEALEYIKEVEKKFEGKKEKFEEFLSLMSEYKHHRFD